MSLITSITKLTKRINRRPNQRTSNPYLLMLAIAIFISATANVGFFVQVNKVYPFIDNVGFMVSLALVLTGLLWLLMLLSSYRYTIKAVLIIIIMIAAIAGHFTDSYGTIYDTTMLQNAMQTDTAEAGDLLNIRFLLRVLLLGIVPSVWIAKQRLAFPRVSVSLLQRVGALLTSVTLIGIPILLLSGQYASFFREHKPLRYYTNPITPIYSTVNLMHIEYKKFTAPTELMYHAKDATQMSNTTTRKAKLVVMIVGETLRSANIPFNGYARNTLPQISQLQKSKRLTYFRNMTACGTSTAYSLPCMFSYLGESDYNVDEADYHENVIDTLNRLGVRVYWLDNNSSSKGVMNRLPSEQYYNYKNADNNPNCDNPYQECRDIGMLTKLNELLTAQQRVQTPGQDTLIILHQMGNHGPAYYKRYDDKFAQFLPVCQSNELAECDSQSLINGYDNAILATDDLLAKTIDWLKSHQDQYEVAMLYTSDHGESLGEKGIYLHGMPKSFAPRQQYEIPAMIWLSKDSELQAVNTETPLNHDAITPTLLSLFDIQTKTVEGHQKFVK